MNMMAAGSGYVLAFVRFRRRRLSRLTLQLAPGHRDHLVLRRLSYVPRSYRSVSHADILFPPVVASIEETAERYSIPKPFIGLILLPIVVRLSLPAVPVEPVPDRN